MGYGKAALFLAVLILIFYFIEVRACARSPWSNGAAIIFFVFLFLFGNYRMATEGEKSRAEYLAEKEAYVTAQGQIERLSKTSFSDQIYLKHVVLKSEEERIECPRIVVMASDSPALKIGNIVSFQGKLKEIQKPGNPGEFDRYLYNKAEEIACQMKAESIQILDDRISIIGQTLYEWKKKMLSVLKTITIESDYGIYAAMLLGEKKEMDGEIKRLYTENGISHILAISGQHISLIGFTLYQLLRKKLDLKRAGGIASIVLFFYVKLIGNPPSAMRAWMMFSVLLLAPCVGRTYDILSAAAQAALFMLFWRPFLLTSAAFLLSFSAVFGIGMVSASMQGFLRADSPLVRGFFSGLAIQWTTVPVTSYFYFTFYPYGLFLNLLILPVAGLVMAAGFIGILTGFFSRFLGTFCVGIGHYLLVFYESLCRLCERLPNHDILTGRPLAFGLILYYGFLIMLCGFFSYTRKRGGIHKKGWKKRAGTIFIASIALLSILTFRPSSKLSVTFLDVSQGDGIFIETPSKTTFFIDGGSSDIRNLAKYRLIPFLLAKKKNEIDYAIVTHADSDHINGLRELLSSDQIFIKHLLMPVVGNPDEAYEKLVNTAKESNTEVLYLEEGMRFTSGEVKFQCLFPYRGIMSEDRNDSSTVLRMSYGEVDFLFTGDLGEEGEEYLLEHGLLKCEILKAGHHGSQYSSSPKFLEALSPDLAVISCGKRNSYGHPHAETLKRMEDCKIEVFTTIDHGALMIQSDGKSYEVKGYRDGRIPIFKKICYTE